jgi:pimeloyl-ACP methyl ester carboxylesterase
VALEVVRQHPETVRSAVFDSAYPPDQPIDGAELVAQAELAFGVLSAGCAADAACSAAHGDVTAGLQALVDAWNADPHEATIEDPDTGEERQLVITGGDVVAGLWNAMYDDALLGLLPSLPAALLNNDPITEVVIQQLATDGLEQLTGAAEAVAGAVDCADRQRLDRAPDDEVITSQPFYAGLVVLGSRMCDVWDVEPVDASFNEPVSSDVASLFLGNEYDPVTPPGDTEATAARFPNGTYVEFPGLGHGAVFAHGCPTSIFLAFIADPTAPVDTSCVATMGPPEWTV